MKMKTKPFLILFALLVMVACQPKTEMEPVDVEAVKDAVTSILDNYHAAMIAGNVDDCMSLLENKGLYCGTDPIELWDKDTLSNEMTKAMADTSFTINYDIDKRIIRVASDGKTALVLEQFTMSMLSEKIPIRFISHMLKTDENWMIDFLSWSFVPHNEDIAKLNNAFE
jgi:hypothetical protein